MADLHFELVTPEKLVLSEDVHMVVVPGTEGEFGVMAGHAPVMATIKDNAELAVYRTAGATPEKIRVSATPEKIRVSGGFAEVGDKGLTVLAESAEG
jgi:F-type H+-transporting ATPase subunit epsilon